MLASSFGYEPYSSGHGKAHLTLMPLSTSALPTKPRSWISVIDTAECPAASVHVGEQSAGRASSSNVPSARAFCAMRLRSPAEMIGLN